VTGDRVVAIVPAWNEAGAIGGVVDEIKGVDPRIAVVVIVTPGQDTALTSRTTPLGGRQSGPLTATGRPPAGHGVGWVPGG